MIYVVMLKDPYDYDAHPTTLGAFSDSDRADETSKLIQKRGWGSWVEEVELDKDVTDAVARLEIHDYSNQQLVERLNIDCTSIYWELDDEDGYGYLCIENNSSDRGLAVYGKLLESPPQNLAEFIKQVRSMDFIVSNWDTLKFHSRRREIQAAIAQRRQSKNLP